MVMVKTMIMTKIGLYHLHFRFLKTSISHKFEGLLKSGTFPTITRNLLSFTNNWYILCHYGLTGYFTIKVWKCYLLSVLFFWSMTLYHRIIISPVLKGIWFFHLQESIVLVKKHAQLWNGEY